MLFFFAFPSFVGKELRTLPDADKRLRTTSYLFSFYYIYYYIYNNTPYLGQSGQIIRLSSTYFLLKAYKESVYFLINIVVSWSRMLH